MDFCCLPGVSLSCNFWTSDCTSLRFRLLDIHESKCKYSVNVPKRNLPTKYKSRSALVRDIEAAPSFRKRKTENLCCFGYKACGTCKWFSHGQNKRFGTRNWITCGSVWTIVWPNWLCSLGAERLRKKFQIELDVICCKLQACNSRPLSPQRCGFWTNNLRTNWHLKRKVFPGKVQI